MGIRLLSQQRPTGGGGGGVGGDLDDLDDVNVPSPTDGYVLAWNNGAGLWEAVSAGTPSLPLTTKGDILGYDTAAERIPVGGTQGHVLTVDSGEALGVKWAEAPGAGGANWTDVVLSSDFDTSATSQQTTDLAFTPAASKTYEFYAMILAQSDTAIYGVKPGILWPSAGVADGAAFMDGPESATSHEWRNETGGTDGFANVNSHTDFAGQSLLQRVIGLLVTNGSISGNLVISCHAENAAGVATFRTGSLLKYREIA